MGFETYFQTTHFINGRYHLMLSSMLSRRHPATSLSTSNRLQESLFREEVLRQIFRVPLGNSLR